MTLDARVIEGFVQSCLLKKFSSPTPIPNIHREWWNICCSDSNFVAIAAPRSHAKSTAITFSYVLASLLFREYRFVVIVSDTESQATLFLGDIKQELLENEDIITLFGVKKFVKLAETDIIVEMSDGHRFRVMARGSEQKARGAKWDAQRPDLIVCDDLESDEQVESQERRIKFRRWFYGALLPSRDLTRSKVIVVGTVLHADSLLERLMPKLSDKNTVIDNLRIYSTRQGMWKAVKYRAHTPGFEKILWKDKFPKDKLIDIRQDYIDQGMPDVYSQEYLNEPIDLSVSYFRRDELKEFIVKDYDQKWAELPHYVGVDFAVSKETRSDYTAFVVVAVDEHGRILVRKVRRGRWDSFEICDKLFEIQAQYKPEFYVCEKGVIVNSIWPFLSQQMIEKNIFLNFVRKVANKDKYTRARSIQARIRAGGVFFDKKEFWWPEFEEEMVKFPRYGHDDQVDAFAWIGLELDNLQQAKTSQEIDDEHFFAEKQTTYENYQGRDYVCGY